MSNQETVKGIREQLKVIKEAITVIEFKLSQLESNPGGPERAAAAGEATAWS